MYDGYIGIGKVCPMNLQLAVRPQSYRLSESRTMSLHLHARLRHGYYPWNWTRVDCKLVFPGSLKVLLLVIAVICAPATLIITPS